MCNLFFFKFQMIMDLTFEEAARGVNKEINLNVQDTCPKCRGSGAEPGSSPVKCPQCNGTGMVCTYIKENKKQTYQYIWMPSGNNQPRSVHECQWNQVSDVGEPRMHKTY